jgi:Bacterial transcriptional repressor
MRISVADAAPVATSMVVVVTYWLSFEYVRDPRRALEPESAAAAMGRGAFHALALLLPHLDEASRTHLRSLAAAYVPT